MNGWVDFDGIQITLKRTNYAPVLDNSKSPTLATITEDTAAPTNGSTANSTLVSSLVDIGGTLSNVIDSDSGAVTGIAVTGISAQGTLYYTTNGGTTWTAAGTVSASSALLLAADGNTRIVFVSSANFNGTISEAITFKAWDRTAGINGSIGVNTGSGSAFSAATDTASIMIVSVNDQPSIGGAVSGQAVNDTGTISPFSTLTITDPDSDVTVTVALDTAAKGVFTAASLTASGFSTSDGGMTYTHASAAPATMQNAIRQLVFDPTNNRVAVGSSETTTFTVTVSDGVAADVTNNTTTVVAASVNEAPTINVGTYALTGTDEDTSSGGTTVSTILGGVTYADADPSALSGIAVTAKTGNGTWQYSTTGSDGWTAFGAVGSTSVLLLTSSTSVRYVPDATNGETATFTFRAWDQTSGIASTNGTPSRGDSSTNGGTTAFSTATAQASITVSTVNDPPVLDNSKSPTLATIAEDTAAPTNGSTAYSTLVSSLVDIGGGLSNVTDVDPGAVTGIAVTAISGQGTLYYTTNGGANWTAAGTVSASSALLLAADANTRIAFVPQANLVGTDTDAITFKAWDRSSGNNGDTGVNTGVGSAFSTATDMAPIVITGVNDAPTINAGPYTLTGTDEDNTSSATQIATIITALGYADVDVGAITGIAITATTANGKWQYSTDGSTGWTDFGAVSNTAALLLTSGTYVRFVPDGFNGETATFTFRAWDRTGALASVNGTPRYADTSTNGGSSEFSTGTANASITVASVNDAPMFVGGMTTLTIGENSGASSIKALLHASDADSGQTLTWSESAAPAHGTLTFSSATAATGGGDITPGGTITYTPTPNYVGSDSFTVQVSDGTASATRTINVTLNVVATELRFTTQPSGSVSDIALTGQPVVMATDASGNVDTTFTGNVTLSLGSGAGSLSGTLVKAAVAGVATFTDLAYTATADRQAFTITTANAAGLTNATSDSVTSDVVATKLRFSTQPAPVTMVSTVTRTFTTAPAVQAVDAANVVDLDYSAAIMLSLTKNDGTAAPGTVNSVSGIGDTDGSSTTVTLAPMSGTVTFSGLSVRYTHAASTDSLALHATSGALTAANSTTITCREDSAPVVNTLTTGGSFTEGGAAVPVSYAATVTDADDTTCAWATVSIIQNFTAGQDVLSFTNDGSTMGNITAVYDAGTGVLTLTSAGATATKFQWANAVKAVKYANTSDAPNTATRQMVFVANDGYLSSDPAYAYCKTNVTVIATNDAPTLSGGPFTLTSTNVDAMSSATPVSTILADVTYVDPDGSVASGIAVTAKTGNGSWAYSTDGVTWAAIGTVSDNSALLLTSATRIRYLPNGIDAETATITFRGWDQTSGSASTNSTRGLANASINGGTTAFSTGAAIAQIAVADNVPPTVASINRQTPENAATNATTVVFRVTFQEIVTGVDSADFTLTKSGTANGVVGTVSAVSGKVYDVTVNTVAGDGTLRLDLNNGGTGIADAVGNDISGGYTGGGTYTVDQVAPIVSSIDRQTPAGVLTNAASVVYRVTFSENVGNVDTGDFTLAKTGTANGNIASISAISGSTYDVTVDTVSGDGTLRLDLKGSGTGIMDTVGNAIDGGYTAGQIYTVDHTALTVSVASTAPDPINYRTIHVTVTFSEPVIGFSSGDVTLGNATLSNFSGSGTTYTFDLAAVGNGAFTANVDAGIATDGAGNGNTQSNYLQRTYDPNRPSVVITSAAPNPTGTSPIPVTVTFSEYMPYFTSSDVSIGNGTINDFTGDGTVFTFNVVPSGQGYVTVVVAEDATTDYAMNGNTASNTLSVIYDTVAPTVAISSTASNPTRIAPIPVTVTFSETVNGFTSGNISVSHGTISNFAGSGANYTFDVTPSGQGDVTVNVAADVATDDAGNSNTAASPLSLTYDSVAPTVTSAAVPATGIYGVGQNLDFTVNFDENVTVDATGGTPNITLTLDTGGTVRADYVSGSGTSALVFRYTVASGNSDPNGVSVGNAIMADGGTIKDAAGNDAALALNNIASTSGMRVDTAGPEITFIKPTDGASLNTNNGSMVIVSISDLGSGIDASSIELQIDGGSWTDPISVVGNTVYFLLGQLGNGSHTLTVRARDNVGNETTQTITIIWNHYRRGFGFGRFSF